MADMSGSLQYFFNGSTDDHDGGTGSSYAGDSVQTGYMYDKSREHAVIILWMIS